MKTMETKRALAALAALSQEHRLAIFRLLVEHAPEGLPAGLIAERLSLAPATASFHLKELSHAGLIASRQDGRFIWYRADLEAMNGLVVPAGAPRPVAATMPTPTRRKRKSA